MTAPKTGRERRSLPSNGIYGHGPTRREQQMLDLQEAGNDPAAIAKEMGISPDSVRRILTALSGRGGNEWMNAAGQGSDALLRAMDRARLTVPAPPPSPRLSFEQQLARVADGAGICATFRPGRPAPDMTLGGVASALL